MTMIANKSFIVVNDVPFIKCKERLFSQNGTQRSGITWQFSQESKVDTVKNTYKQLLQGRQIDILSQTKITRMMLDMAWGNFFTHTLETGP